MSEVIDLDALAPESRKVKFGGNIIEVLPPKTGALLKLAKLGSKMKEADTLPEDELDTVMDSLEAQIKNIIPQLAEATLASGQLMSLLTLIMEMGLPEQMAELKKQGIEVDSSKKA